MTGGRTPLEHLAQTGVLPDAADLPAPLYWMWLGTVLGPGSAQTGAVLDRYDSPLALWQDRDNPGFAQALGRAAMRRWKTDPIAPADLLPLWQRCADEGVRVLTPDDGDYPVPLTRIPDLPAVLYCTGRTEYLNARPAVGVVGSRTPTGYGAEAARTLTGELAGQGVVIVSGMADGLDSEAHKAALDAGGITIAVVGVPIDKTYPARNRALRSRIEADGAVISEYAPGASVDYHASFLHRNRIIAALSQALVVVEAREKSGTLNTVGHAESYGRPICAVPGGIFAPLSEGTNGLIKSGRARMVTCAADILEPLGLQPKAAMAAPVPAQPARPLSGEEKQVLDCIGAKPAGLEQIVSQCGLPVHKVLAALIGLEMGGWILAQPGQRYVLK